MGGWVGDRIEDIGQSIEDVIVDPVSDALASFEDSVRNVVTPVFDGFNDVIENPYVQMVATIIDPTPGKIASSTLRAYAKANSGEELTASDLAQLGISSVTALGDVPIDPNTAKVMKSAAAVADGADLQDVIVSNFGAEAFDALAPELQETARTAFGDDVYTLVQENIDPIKAGFRIASGESPTQVLAETYGDQIVGALGSDDPTVNALGYAGLKTAVGLDQGLDTDEALLAGGEEYYKRGGALPDLNQVASLAGIQDFNLNLNDVVGDLGLDFPDLSLQGYDLPSLANLGIDLNQFSFEAPDILDMNLSLPEIAGLGLDLGNVKFEGYSPQDLGFDVGELADLGINLGDLNLDFETLGLGLALQGQQPKEFTPEGDEIASLENEFLVPQIETPFSQQVLGNLKIV